MSVKPDILKEIKYESDLLRVWQHEYYVLGRPSVDDLEYDAHFDHLTVLEKKYPQYRFLDSPTLRVGSDLANDLPEAKHSIPVLSLDKAYSVEQLLSWSDRTALKYGQNQFSLVVEEKIDGISIVLYYEEGRLIRAITRGNGSVGNDVTANIKTIGAIPLLLCEPVTVAVRGEVFLPISCFKRLNKIQEIPYANPRNLAAGTIRRKKSSEAAAVPLEIFIYEGFFQDSARFQTHFDILKKLSFLGFRLNPRAAWFFSKGNFPDEFLSLDQLSDYISKMTQERRELDYEIDGLVLKVNEVKLRMQLGYTGHHPRWAIAFKFESPSEESEIESIDIQVGRTGRVTPVARIKPVLISGSRVSNVTLHNQDYINALQVSVGDRVCVSKRGDVIPAVESVIEKGLQNQIWKMPSYCPSCHSSLKMQGAHHFCINKDCVAQRKGKLLFFVGKSQMDIDGLGEETVDFLFRENLVHTLVDLFTFDYLKLHAYPGFADRKIAQIEAGLKEAKKKPYEKLLASMGFSDVGPKVCELLVEEGITSMSELITIVLNKDRTRLEAVHGIGPKTVDSIFQALSNDENLKLIAELQKAGFRFEAKVTQKLSSFFKGQRWCVTGSFENYKPRSLAVEEIKKRGGAVSGSVSGSTTHLLAGEGAGSKLAKADKMGVEIISESDFISLLTEDSHE